MHDFNEIIEKYTRELLEFSKQMPKCAECANKTDANTHINANLNSQKRETEDYRPEHDVQEHIVIEPYTDYEDFLRRNGSSGKLRVQVFAADRSFPISDAYVTVAVSLLGGSKDLFGGRTNSDGIIDNISLPAPNKSLSLNENNSAEPFALYNIRVSHPDYADGEYFDIPVFDSVKSIQPVELVPVGRSDSGPSETDFGGERYA